MFEKFSSSENLVKNSGLAEESSYEFNIRPVKACTAAPTGNGKIL
jgi:hypothetical protein